MSECYRCHQRGHFARECPRGEVFANAGGFPRGRGGGGGRGISNGFPGRGAQCYRCSEYGHFARECPQGSNEVFSGDGCFICGQQGHFARKCSQGGGETNRGFRGGGRGGFRPEVAREGCFNCGRLGHFARDCRVRGGSECYSCGKEGHYSRDCPDGRWRSGNSVGGSGKGNEDKKCYKCGNLGHISRDCPTANKPESTEDTEEGANAAEKEEPDEAAGLNFKCEKCDQPGHTASTCEKETGGDEGESPVA